MSVLHKAALAASISTSVAGFLLTAPIASAQAAAIHTYHLPAQALAASLRDIALASGISIGAAAEVIGERQAPALDGDFTARAAVAALLVGSGLHLRPVANGLVIEAGATPAGEGGERSGEDPVEILVTGSRIRGAPVASPSIVVDAATMRDQGATGLGDVMRGLPQSFGGGQNPGIATNVPSASGTNVGGASTINLRGLGSDATLTLLNGHRLAYNGTRQGIDLSSIPFGMVNRVEIVADGASALYGSDAVAGVANIVLKRDYAGLETSANIGGATEGGDFQQQYGAVAGHRWGSGGLVAAYEYSSNTGIMSNERDFARSRPGVMLYPAMRHHAAALSAHQALTDTLTFDVDAIFNKRWSLGGYATNTAGDRSVSHVDAHSTSRSGAIAPALKLRLPGGWDLSLSGVYGTETVTLYNAIYTGTALTSSTSGCYCNSGSSVEFAADGHLFPLPAGAVKLALGAGYRTNSLVLFRGAGLASNIDASQDSTYAYGEVSLPLVSRAQGVEGIDRLNLSGALRYERYPGVASIATPKLGIIYAPIADLVLKGSWGRSFRAPTLFQQYAPQYVAIYPAASLGGTGYAAGSTAMLLTGGNAGLKPERAETWSASLEFQPRQIPGLRIQLSYFATLYKNRIVTPITYTAQSLSNPLYASLVTSSPDVAGVNAAIGNPLLFSNVAGGTFDPGKVIAIVNDTNLNAGRQTIRGIDMLVDYKVKLGRSAGQLGLSGNLAYLTSSQILLPGSSPTALAGTLFNPPHWRGTGSVTWARGDLTLNAPTSYIGGVIDARFGPQLRVLGMVTQDLTARYALSQGQGPWRGLTLSVTARNMFNSRPGTIATTAYYDAAYDSTNYAPVGRYLGVGVTKAW